jgi:hypothetical protein
MLFSSQSVRSINFVVRSGVGPRLLGRLSVQESDVRSVLEAMLPVSHALISVYSAVPDSTKAVMQNAREESTRSKATEFFKQE